MTTAAQFVEGMQSHGRYVFTQAEAEAALGVSGLTLDAALRRLKEKTRIAAVRRTFYVIVPSEHLTAGAPPATWFIDDLMRFLGQPYYVGLLSAAALHGAGHQQPMTFHVVTDRPTRGSRIGRSRLAFHVRKRMASARVARLQTETGSMSVSTPETTAFDVVRFMRASGGVSNVATVLGELAESVSAPELGRVAADYGTPTVQRLGFLLDHIGESVLADEVEQSLKARRFRPTLLVSIPHQSPVGRSADSRWRVVENESVESDE